MSPLRDMHHYLSLVRDLISDKTRIIFLYNPNNPTGSIIPPVELYQFLSNIPETVIVVLDEAYIDFADKQQRVDMYSLIKNNEGRCPVVFFKNLFKSLWLSRFEDWLWGDGKGNCFLSPQGASTF